GRGTGGRLGHGIASLERACTCSTFPRARPQRCGVADLAMATGLAAPCPAAARARESAPDHGTSSRIAAMSGYFPLYDNAALRQAEARAASRLGGDFVLMQRAGLAAWRCALAHWPQAQRIAIACGPGNNGGDGYVLARHAHAAGRQVRVLRLHGHAPRGEVANRAERAYRDAGGCVEEFDGSIGDADLVV